MWKQVQEDAQFENSQMIGGQANCNECGKRCRTMHNLKIHKLSDDDSIAMILKEMQENAQFEDT